MPASSPTWPARLGLALLLAASLAAGPAAPALSPDARPAAVGPGLPYPILFVTQIPIAADFTTIGSVFGNHDGDLDDAGRGGDLYIRYPNGTLKNLTAAAGYGGSGLLTGAEGIAVRDPAVSWDGAKAVFSMVVGAPSGQNDDDGVYRWQLYEITGLGLNDDPVITKVPNQPAAHNNVSPIYLSDGSLLFTSDRPRNGAAHLYPQLDEYEKAPTVTGLWRLVPSTGALTLLNHAPSGDFTPSVDSFGRVIFTQWDHLQRDQEADADAAAVSYNDCYSGGDAEDLPYGSFNYTSEAANAAPQYNNRAEVFPEPRGCRDDLLAGTDLAGHTMNQFFPWQMNQDGTESEVLNHLGRHELAGYIPQVFNYGVDPALEDFYGQFARFNPNSLSNMLQIEEDPLRPGTYYAIDAPEFATHAAGQVISTTAPPALDADHIAIRYVTHRDTASYDDTPDANDTGHYRDPLPLTDGTLIAAHTTQTDSETGTGFNSNYAFRLKTLTKTGSYWVAGAALTGGISKTVSYWDPYSLLSYSGYFWELSPVEVRARTIPPFTTAGPLPAPEQQRFNAAGALLGEFRAYLAANNLALLVSRNVTTRDDFDLQQPYNLKVLGGTQTVTGTGQIYTVAFLQFFQGDQLRGYTGGYGNTTPQPGRRVIAQALHDPAALLLNDGSGGPPGSVVIAPDGSMAAVVPAGRALTWQLTDAGGEPVVRERYWLTFQPGEVRVCTSCHGLSQYDQSHHLAPTNSPQALQDLLEQWQVYNALTERVYLPQIGH
ncbi:MAG: hypothetical protein IT317_19895 [Anaerolineales bacterium]|nr:hypothetical protein [Anaerolineales bacterium]